MTLVHDPNAYEDLKSPCGDMVSILRPFEGNKHAKPEKHRFDCGYEYTTSRLSRDTEVQASIVLLDTKTQKRYVLAQQIRLRGWSTGSGGGSMVLPKDLPAGKYRVFFEVRDGEKVISTGHYFVADL